MLMRGRVGVRRIGQRPASIRLICVKLATLLMAGTAIVAAGCLPAVTVVQPTATAVVVVPSEPATLIVDVKPPGATLLVDDQPRGTTPLTLSLSPGQYVVRVEMSGYQAMEESVVLSSRGRVTVNGSLLDVQLPTLAIQVLPKSPHTGQHVVIYANAYDNVAVARLELWIDGQRILEEVGATAIYHWDLPLDAVGQHVVVGRAYDVTGNVVTLEQPLTVAVAVSPATAMPTTCSTATPSPTPSPSPTGTPLPTATLTPLPESTPSARPTLASAVSAYYETVLSIDTYPYADYLWEETDVRYGSPLWRLDRAAYEEAHPTPMPKPYRALVVENEYLQLTFLPDLGGRLYRCIYKPTGQNLFYQNPVIKPSRWGVLTPTEHNWWLAAGGMEWALPVQEHGYEFGVPWDYAIQVTSEGVTIALWDSKAEGRLQYEVKVTLPSRQAVFTVQPRLMNPLAGDVKVQLWLNAMLTLGSHTIAPETEFVFPEGPMVVHSTGDAAMAAMEVMNWPMHGGRDLSRYANWRQWLGVFVQQPGQNFVGAYNHATGLGVARVFPSQIASGIKLFAFGSEFDDRDHYTDDGSQYFELWGGLNRTFWPADDVLLAAGGEITWQETWHPFAGIGGLTYANETVALNLKRLGDQVDLGLSVSTPVQGWVRVLAGEGGSAQAIWEQAIALLPTAPLRQQITLPVGLGAGAKLRVQLTDQESKILLDYSVKD